MHIPCYYTREAGVTTRNYEESSKVFHSMRRVRNIYREANKTKDEARNDEGEPHFQLIGIEGEYIENNCFRVMSKVLGVNGAVGLTCNNVGRNGKQLTDGRGVTKSLRYMSTRTS